MKRIRKITAACLLCCHIVAALLLASCADFSDATHEIAARIQLQLPDELAGTSAMAGRTVTLTIGTQHLQAETDAQGVATFSGLIPDIYDISCSWELTAADYQTLTGKELDGGTSCTVSGSANTCLLLSDGQTVSLPTLLSINQDLLISKIYYAGSTYEGTNKAYTGGQYMELYNQSASPIDVSGIYIGLTETDSEQAYTLENLHEAYADTMVVLKQIFRIPVEQPVIIQPGGALLITNSAIDHSSVSHFEYDQSDADLEAKDSQARKQNNPATPELPIVFCSYSGMTYINFMNNGLMGVVLFRTDEDVVNDWKPVYAYGKTTGNLMYKLLPKRYIIDGVECLANKTNTGPDVSAKRLYSDIDAGYTFINSVNGRTGEVVYRKTARIAEDGRKILADTNNSSADFQVSTTIKPREYDAAEAASGLNDN